MGLLSNLFGRGSDDDIVGIGDNLQEAMDDYAVKVKSVNTAEKELVAIEVGDTDECGIDNVWFTLKLKG